MIINLFHSLDVKHIVCTYVGSDKDVDSEIKLKIIENISYFHAELIFTYFMEKFGNKIFWNDLIN